MLETLHDRALAGSAQELAVGIRAGAFADQGAGNVERLGMPSKHLDCDLTGRLQLLLADRLETAGEKVERRLLVEDAQLDRGKRCVVTRAGGDERRGLLVRCRPGLRLARREAPREIVDQPERRLPLGQGRGESLLEHCRLRLVVEAEPERRSDNRQLVEQHALSAWCRTYCKQPVDTAWIGRPEAMRILLREQRLAASAGPDQRNVLPAGTADLRNLPRLEMPVQLPQLGHPPDKAGRADTALRHPGRRLEPSGRAQRLGPALPQRLDPAGDRLGSIPSWNPSVTQRERVDVRKPVLGVDDEDPLAHLTRALRGDVGCPQLELTGPPRRILRRVPGNERQRALERLLDLPRD